MSRENDDILLGHEQSQGRPRAASATGAAVLSSDVSAQAPSAIGCAPGTGAAPVAKPAGDATSADPAAPVAGEKAASKGIAPNGRAASKGSPKKSRFRTARGWVALACVAFVLVGMAFHVGIGTPSAFGIQQISAICPLGALETMAGAKGVMLHPLLLFALVVVLIALVGKAFCAWMCPVPWLQKFFRPKKRAASAKSAVERDAAPRSGAGGGAAAGPDAGHDAAAKSGAGHDAPASCGESVMGFAQTGASTSGPVNAAKAQTGMVSDASCQKTRECVLSAADECANDALHVTTAASGHATNACAADSGSCSLDFARTRAIFGSKTAEPGEAHPTCTPFAAATAATDSAAARGEGAGESRLAHPAAPGSAPASGNGAAIASSTCAFASEARSVSLAARGSGASRSSAACALDPAAAPGSAPASEVASTCTPSACSGCAGASACAKALAPVGGARDGVRLDSRHAVLVGTLASAAVFGFPVFCLICPVGLTFATIIGLWNLVQFNEPTWALVVFPIILIAEVTVLRKWCSKICPISALVSLLSNLNVTLRPRVKADACLRSRGVDCHACVDACPEQLDPHSRRIPECSKCGKCVEACPAKAISIKLLK